MRHEFLLHVGIAADTVARTGDAFALSELSMRYIRPLRSSDRFRGCCRVAKCTAARAVFEQQIWLLPRRRHAAAGSAAAQEGQQEELVLTAEAVVVSLDSAYKPKRMSAALRERLLASAAVEGPLISLQEIL